VRIYVISPRASSLAANYNFAELVLKLVPDLKKSMEDVFSKVPLCDLRYLSFLSKIATYEQMGEIDVYHSITCS
jgi:hypothetical protein